MVFSKQFEALAEGFTENFLITIFQEYRIDTMENRGMKLELPDILESSIPFHTKIETILHAPGSEFGLCGTIVGDRDIFASVRLVELLK
ncbi:MAG: hypothetical protein WCY93_11275 [Anaerolineaceae bacterium]